MRALPAMAGLLLALYGPAATALEYRSVGEAPATLYDGPSLKSQRTHVISRATPVEVITALEGWVKIREPGGQLGWVEAGGLSTARRVVVTETAVARADASDDAAAVFEARPGLILDYLETDGLWARVRHRDGLAGFIRTSHIWGL